MDKRDEAVAPEDNYAFTDQLYVNIIKAYLDIGSVKETAAKLGTSVVKVRKVLITEGLWSSKNSLEIKHYLNMGKSTVEIANILSTTEKAVQQYLPYTRGIYRGDNQSRSALNSAEYRHRIQILQERILKKSRELAVENKWHEMIEESSIEKEDKIKMTAGIEDTHQMVENSALTFSEPERHPGALLLPEDSDAEKISLAVDPIRLHLELVRNNCDPEDTTRILTTYGQVKYGETISRDVVVPDDMPLWAVHYMIQKCFGWQNSHLHSFELPDGQFERITDGTMGKYADLIGVVFRSPIMDENEEFWNDDYESGSYKTWIRKKYTGPYASLCHGEGIWQCKQDVIKMRKALTYVKVKHYFGHGSEYYGRPEPIKMGEYKKRVNEEAELHEDIAYGRAVKYRTEVYAFDNIPIDVVGRMFERPSNQLLERLTVGEVFAVHDRRIDDRFFEGDFIPECFDDVMDEDTRNDVIESLQCDLPTMQPMIGSITDELYYHYDFGDDWCVKITASFGTEDLIGRVTQEELEEAVKTIMTKHRPVCIAQDGYSVLDDVGGLHGFVQFLKGINQTGKRTTKDNEENVEEYGPCGDKSESLEWAKSLGWSKRMVSNKSLL